MEKHRLKLILTTLEFVLRNFVNHKNPDVVAHADNHRTNILTAMEELEDSGSDSAITMESFSDETLRMLAGPKVDKPVFTDEILKEVAGLAPLALLHQDGANPDLDPIVKSVFGDQATLFNAVDKPTESLDGSSED